MSVRLGDFLYSYVHNGVLGNKPRGAVGLTVSFPTHRILNYFNNAMELEPEKLHIINDVPYFHRLDTGWSSDAPDGITKPHQEAMRVVFVNRIAELFARTNGAPTKDQFHAMMINTAWDIIEWILQSATPFDAAEKRDRIHARYHYEVPEGGRITDAE